MSQKNKIFSITLLLLILGSVACRKSGGGGGDPTPVNPTINAGGLLIISTNGATNINSINLSFANANGTLTEVSSEETTLQTFKKSKFDTTDKQGNSKENQDSISGGDITSEPHENIFFQNSQFAVGTDDTTKFFLTNSQDGKKGNQLSVAEFTTILSNSIKKNTDIQNYNSLDFEITSLTNKDAPRIATWTIKFKPSVFYNEHSILLNMSKKDDADDVGGWVD